MVEDFSSINITNLVIFFSESHPKMAPGRATYQKIAASTPSTAQLRQLPKEAMYDK
jgi:hypothetical protein